MMAVIAGALTIFMIAGILACCSCAIAGRADQSLESWRWDEDQL